MKHPRILVIERIRTIRPKARRAKWDKIVIDEELEVEQSEIDFLRTRLNPQNPNAEIIIGKITSQ